jgi:hypothetical protein
MTNLQKIKAAKNVWISFLGRNGEHWVRITKDEAKYLSQANEKAGGEDMSFGLSENGELYINSF